MKYRKKPIIIEAFRLGVDDIPMWFFKQIENKNVIFDTQNFTADIKTLEGMLHVNRGDYIIKGVRGELYPCKKDIFIQTYEKVDVDNETILKYDYKDF